MRKIRLDGRPFSFAGHAYLRQLYNDTASHIVLSKAAQVGGTVWALLRSVHSCLVGLSVGYYFPTRTDAIELSKSRVAPLLAENPFLRRLMQDTDAAGLKRLGDAYLYLRGMQSTVGMKSIPLDMIVFDELDEAEPAAKAMAKERLAHSSYKRIIELSNPSLPDYGIDEAFQRSDQRHWTMHCAACGAWTALDREFPTKLGQEVRVLLPREDGTVYRACPKCAAELDTEQGEWVGDYPGRTTHGYQISQLFSSLVDPGEILREYRTTRFPDRFFNLKVGIAWADLERRLDIGTVLSLCGDEPMEAEAGQGRYTLGVDTGRDLHCVVLRQHQGTRRLVHLGTCSAFEELDALLQRFRIDRCVIDGLPETHATREFARRNSWRVSMCFFNEHQRGAPKWDADALTVLVNRTEALDASRTAIREKQVVLPRQSPLLEEFAKHLAADAKVLDEDADTGVKKYRYVRTGADHYSLAFTYAWLGLEKPSGLIYDPSQIMVPDDPMPDWEREFR